MSKPSEKREVDGARTLAETLEFLKEDQRRADESRKAVQKSRKKSQRVAARPVP